MGNFIRSLAEGVTLVASANTWIEDNAIQQLKTTAQLTGMVKVVGMPDLHPGRGYPIGAAFFTENWLYPALVGGDIGCGMSLWQTDINSIRLNLDKLEKQIGNIDEALTAEECKDLWASIEPTSGDGYAPGTIGTGNHFAELQLLDTVYDGVTANNLGLTKKNLQLLVHSGSRGLGGAILNNHVRVFGHQGLQANSDAAKAYLTQHHHALAFAVQNRELIAKRILKNVKADASKLVDISHNLMEEVSIEGVTGWVHRKGAAPANKGLVVIPGSRGDYSYLVRPINGEQTLWSLAHGAGRKWVRSDCKGRLSNRYTANQLRRTNLGSRVICCDRELLYEEAPQAYKSIETVIASMEGASLIEPIARFKPLITYKMNKEVR